MPHSSSSSSSLVLAPTLLEAALNLAEARRLLTKYSYKDNNDDEISSPNNSHEEQQQQQPRHYSYGTAGFRYLATELCPIMIRVGLAAVLLSLNSSSRSSSSSLAVGVMITASHNTAEYNGVKLAGVDGGMIDAASEDLAVYIVNERNIDTLMQFLQDKLRKMSATGGGGGAAAVTGSTGAIVHIGRDTRDHSVALACLVKKAAVAMGSRVVDHGVVTTPMLHHAVKHANAAATTSFSLMLPLAIPLRLNTAGYYELLVHSYLALLATKIDEDVSASLSSQDENPVLMVDCACGVGYPHLVALLARLEPLKGVVLLSSSSSRHNNRRIVAKNPPGSGPLNEGCGSECVQKDQTACKWYDGDDDNNELSSDAAFAAGGGENIHTFNSNNSINNNFDQTYCASLDGDADRIVFFSSVNNVFTLLDGDKMACLIGNFIQDQLTAVLEACRGDGAPTAAATVVLPCVKLGVVQTAYANGASTDYLQSQGVATCIAKTGVKFVHAAAHHHFDIGVYFEANGHGTVLFGDRYYDFLYEAEKAMSNKSGSSCCTKQAFGALQRLRVLPALVNQAVGDALSDLLLVDAILQLQGWSIAHWARALYQDLPSRQLKVKVADRTVIETNENETECLSPTSVQSELQAAMQQCRRGRAFVRPSGTEDVVRIYAEAETAQQADALAAKAAEIVYRLCGGVGDAPSHSRM